MRGNSQMRLEGQLSPTKNRMDPGTPVGPISIRCRRVHADRVGTQGAPPVATSHLSIARQPLGASTIVVRDRTRKLVLTGLKSMPDMHIGHPLLTTRQALATGVGATW